MQMPKVVRIVVVARMMAQTDRSQTAVASVPADRTLAQADHRQVVAVA